MTQLFNITINGISAEPHNGACNISEEMNRFYDVATFEIGFKPSLDQTVVINYGSKTFTGFIHDFTKVDNEIYSVTCRTNGAKLTEPYSPYDETYDDATDSHELCALYQSETGVSITITSEVVTFGGSYERNGTMLSALQNVANITGSEFYDNGSGIVIEPNKSIDSYGTEIPLTDIMDFVKSTDSVYNKGVGFITIRNGVNTEDVISKNGIYCEVDECSGEMFVYPNPYGTIEQTVGTSDLLAFKTERSEEQSILDEDVIYLDGAIDTISKITLNGSEITNMDFVQGHNVLYSNTQMSGTLKVTYTALCYKGYASISQTLSGRFLYFKLFYLDQLLQFQGFLSNDTSCSGGATDGDMTCVIDGDMMYPKGFNVWTMGGVPEFHFYNGITEIFIDVVTTSTNYVSKEDVSLEPMDGGGYRHACRYPIVSVLDARSAGVTVPYTTSNEDDQYYIEFTQYYPSLVVSYETTAIQHYVQFDNIASGIIVMAIINTNTEEVCEYDLDGINEDDMDSIPCQHNQFVPIDAVSQLSVILADVVGQVVTYKDPTGSGGSTIVDAMGLIKIYVRYNGDYVIDTSNLKPRTEITLNVNV